MPSSSSGSWTGSAPPPRGSGPQLAPVQVADDLATDPGGVGLVGGDELGDAGDPRVHLGAAQRLLLRLLPGRHLDQRRAAEEDQPLLADHHREVGHAGLVGAAGGRAAGDEGDARDPGRGGSGQVAEAGAAGDEDLLLARQVGAAGLDEADPRQPVRRRDLLGAQVLAQRVGVAGAAADGRVGGADHALDPLDDADPVHLRGTDLVLGSVGAEGADLEERRVAVEQELNSLAGQQPAAVVVALDALLTAAEARLLLLPLELLEPLEHDLAVRCKALGARIYASFEYGQSRK